MIPCAMGAPSSPAPLPPPRSPPSCTASRRQSDFAVGSSGPDLARRIHCAGVVVGTIPNLGLPRRLRAGRLLGRTFARPANGRQLQRRSNSVTVSTVCWRGHSPPSWPVLLAFAAVQSLTHLAAPAGGSTGPAASVAGENLIAYDLDRLFRGERRPDGDMSAVRAEAGAHPADHVQPPGHDQRRPDLSGATCQRPHRSRSPGRRTPRRRRRRAREGEYPACPPERRHSRLLGRRGGAARGCRGLVRGLRRRTHSRWRRYAIDAVGLGPVGPATEPDSVT